MPDDDPDFLLAREPVADVGARTTAHVVLYAGRSLGGEVVPVGTRRTPEEARGVAVDNVRRLVRMARVHSDERPLFVRMDQAVQRSETFCVAVSRSADLLEERRRAREETRQAGEPTGGPR
jgi:hypothetical protein